MMRAFNWRGDLVFQVQVDQILTLTIGGSVPSVRPRTLPVLLAKLANLIISITGTRSLGLK